MAENEMKANDAESGQNKDCCCAAAAGQSTDRVQPRHFGGSSRPSMEYRWMDGSVLSSSGTVPRVKTKLDIHDTIGSWIVRWGVGRKTYRIPPGLYAVGSPSPESPVLVTANYKMSFDRLRAQLDGRDVWVLVLDTRGINVWCAAGKGTFGTDELVRRVEQERLAEVVTHRTLILPQLGATGVQAHVVKARSGWRVKYGPIRSEDLPAYFDAGMKSTPEMRRMRFSLLNRLALVPAELVTSAKYLFIAVACFLALSGLDSQGYSLEQILSVGSRSALLLFLAYAAGAALTPALLPWLPGPAFSLKGAVAGGLAMILVLITGSHEIISFDNRLEAASWMLLAPAAASFLAMNFTGASTFTSPSGVRSEMRIAVPLQIGAAVVGVVMWLGARFG